LTASPDDPKSTDSAAPADPSRGARIIRFVSRREREAQGASPGPHLNVAAGWVQFAVIVALGLAFLGWFFVFH